jgi:hypothetical protein
MDRRADGLSRRKEMLLARSSLCRVKIRYQADALRHAFSWGHPGASSAAAASPERTAMFLLATESVGRERMARWLAFAGRVLAIAKVTSLVIALLRRPRETAALRPPP